jgi:hypothetical protein
MRNYLAYILLLISSAGCQSRATNYPVWLNKKEIVKLPADTLLFQAAGKHWNATIRSFIQPIQLNIVYSGTGFYLVSKNGFGITEGPAQLILNNGKQDFQYDLALQNSSAGNISLKDYRSPKTMNPDSSLAQHRMIHFVDEWRNTSGIGESSKPFSESIIHIDPSAGTYRAQPDNPLSAYYVQAGSCTHIEVQSSYKQSLNTFEVSAGPLKDKYNNKVADGTMVVFIYNDGIQTYRMEAALLNGFAKISIPAEKNRTYTLTAKVNETVSKPITLMPL